MQCADQYESADNPACNHTSAPTVEAKFDSEGNFDPIATWEDLSEADLLARMMLSEQSNKILDEDKVIDAIGAGWTALNRRDGHPDDFYVTKSPFDLFAVLVSMGQYDGLDGDTSGNFSWAADPGAYPDQFESGNPRAGHEAYYRALELAESILDGSIADPTNGRFFYADADYDENNELVFLERTEFAFELGGPSNYQSILQISFDEWAGGATGN